MANNSYAGQLIDEIKELKAKVEKMKNCENCEHFQKKDLQMTACSGNPKRICSTWRLKE